MGCALNLQSWDQPTLDFAHVEMVHFEPYRIVLAGVIDSKLDRMTIWVFFEIKRLNGGCNNRNIKWILFGMKPDELAFKDHIFTSDFKYWIGVNGVDILTHFFTLLLFIASYQFCENIICCTWFLFGVSCYANFNLHLEKLSMDENMVSKI